MIHSDDIAALPRRSFEATRRPREDARHLPGDPYFSSAIANLENEKLFLNNWLCVGRVEEVENPGDYLAFRIMNEPVLIVRENQSSIIALSNVCRHRGVEIATGKGNTKAFICPYHAWTYDLSGKLIGSPYMKQTKVDLSHCRLPRLQLDLWRGWIFITFEEHAPPLSEVIFPFEKEFGFLEPDSCRLSDKLTIDLECNWKFVVENFMDIYHVGTTHARTVGGLFLGNKEKYALKLLPNGGYSLFFEAMPFTEGGRSLFGKMPWLKERGEKFAARGFLGPNMNLAASADNLRVWITWPTSPTKSRVIWYTLFPNERFLDPLFREKADKYRDFLKLSVEEDREMVESLQNGVQSRTYQPGPFSQLETPIHHLIKHYLDRLTS